MKAIKKPNGKWAVTVYDYTDEDGKQHNKTFTGVTRKDAEQKAEQYRIVNKNRGVKEKTLTVSISVRRYIDIKEPVLSPSTVRTYRSMLREYFSYGFGKMCLWDVTNIDVQRWVSELALEKSPKTVGNVHSLFSAACAMFRPDLNTKVKRPQRMRPQMYAPTEKDIIKLLNNVKPGSCLERAVLLGAFCGLRRGEICALNAEDIDREKKVAYIHLSMVRTPGGGYVIKPPKTDESNRIVPITDVVLSKLPIEGRVCPATPSTITNEFVQLVRRAGLKHFRFHDLRHFYASRLHYAGVPTRIICDMGGWKTDEMMKRVYLDAASDEVKKNMEKVNDAMNTILAPISYT